MNKTRVAIQVAVIIALLAIVWAFTFHEAHADSNNNNKLNLENAVIEGDTVTSSAKIFLQFGENREQKLLTKTKVTPILESGVISICHKQYTLENTEVRVLNKSFRVLAVEDGYTILMYAKSLGDGTFRANAYIYQEGESRTKLTFNLTVY